MDNLVRRMIPVYAPLQPLHSHPSAFVDLETAIEYVKYGVANWANNHGRSIRMKALRPDVEIRGLSCKPGPRIMEAIAANMGWAKAIQAGWA